MQSRWSRCGFRHFLITTYINIPREGRLIKTYSKYRKIKLYCSSWLTVFYLLIGVLCLNPSPFSLIYTPFPWQYTYIMLRFFFYFYLFRPLKTFKNLFFFHLDLWSLQISFCHFKTNKTRKGKDNKITVEEIVLFNYFVRDWLLD